MMDDFARGMKEGIAWSVAWLHKRADWMNDPLAKAVLNGAAFSLGRDSLSCEGLRLRIASNCTMVHAGLCSSLGRLFESGAFIARKGGAHGGNSSMIAIRGLLVAGVTE